MIVAERWRRGGGTRTCSPREQCGKDRSETRRPAQRADRLRMGCLLDAKLAEASALGILVQSRSGIVVNIGLPRVTASSVPRNGSAR